MRVIPLLLICVALATSGCFGKDDEATPTPTSPTGTMTPPTGGGTTPTPPTSGGNATPPPALQPRELCAPSFNFQSNQPPLPPATGPAISNADCGTVPAGYTKLSLMGNFTAGTPPIAGPGIVVKVLDSTGAVAASCAGPGAGPVQAPVACTGDGPAAVGAYTLQYEGTGAVSFAGTVTIRP